MELLAATPSAGLSIYSLPSLVRLWSGLKITTTGTKMETPYDFFIYAGALTIVVLYFRGL